MDPADPHRNQPILTTGVPVADAMAVVVLAHGRGDSAAGILALAQALAVPDVAYLAPQAAGGVWYPNRFLAPLSSNEPWLSSALGRLASVVAGLEAQGVEAGCIVLAGFSQGACLASEFVARNARRYGGLLAFSGGLIGPPGTARAYPGSLAGTPVFLGCSDPDPHIPREHVLETGEVLRRLAASVTVRLYPGQGHTINDDEMEAAREMLAAVRDRRSRPL